MTTKEILKQWFSNLKKPTQNHFWAWIDSYWHKAEKIPMDNIDGLDNALQDVASAMQLQNHLTDSQAHKALFDEIKTQIEQLKDILASDDTELDQLQEIVDYIKQNKEILSQLSISNIAGLENALNKKVDKKPPIIYDNSTSIYLRGDVHREKTFLCENDQPIVVQENSSYNATLNNEESNNYVVTFVKMGAGQIVFSSFENFRMIAPQGFSVNGQIGSSAVMIIDFVRKVQIIRISNI